MRRHHDDDADHDDADHDHHHADDHVNSDWCYPAEPGMLTLLGMGLVMAGRRMRRQKTAA